MFLPLLFHQLLRYVNLLWIRFAAENGSITRISSGPCITVCFRSLCVFVYPLHSLWKQVNTHYILCAAELGRASRDGTGLMNGEAGGLNLGRASIGGSDQVSCWGRIKRERQKNTGGRREYEAGGRHEKSEDKSEDGVRGWRRGRRNRPKATVMRNTEPT